MTTFLGKAIRNTVLLGTFLGGMLFVAQQAVAAVEVFVSIPPQKWLSDKIGGEHITTGVLIQKGQDPHTFEPTPRQVMALTRAQLYFTVGMEFENQIIEKLRQSSMEQKIVDSTAGIQRIALVKHDHNHNHTGFDPHVWLSPVNLKTMAARMTSALIGIDPENSSDYKVNLDKLNRELDALDSDIASQLQAYAGATFFVFHPSFGYFAKRYDLHQEAVEVEGKSPTPKQLANLIAEAKADKVKVIFVQPQFDPRSGQAIARAIGGEVVPLDALAEDVTGNLKTIAAKISAALAQ
ncbi:ABC transporter substrate-binding protein [Desulfopila sp. IMCC35006]|uniref:metal ABC transporter solute-binding protein, Zn/Mn family n=1 Tax=Desulfopila sp. IMCC35006 TaxID=2569542 RepID=UPI0010ABC3D1|nr:zinc ABC transporter substrate-binding protein [Desulfopila sp. IMCC35006]TKB27428.1 ABC transporter substrate-binding protein [Desulfopila sp. IMCC35006]